MEAAEAKWAKSNLSFSLTSVVVELLPLEEVLVFSGLSSLWAGLVGGECWDFSTVEKADLSGVLASFPRLPTAAARLRADKW